MIVIDTHVLVWLVQEDRRLGVVAKAVVEKERGSTGALIPAIMSWEVAMLVDKEKLALGMEAGLWFTHILAAGGFRWMALTPEIGIDAGALPGTIHGDPADRLMIATARHLDCPLVTADEKILAYAAAGHLKAIDARV